jgi:hypothetical protein
MWNPKFDIVSLQMSPFSDEPCLDVFVEQFPDQVKEIQSLAVWTGHWLPGWGDMDSTPWSVMFRFSKLLELVLIVDSYHARDEGRRAQAVGGTEACLTKAKDRLMSKATPGTKKHAALQTWCCPRIRAVGSEDELLSGL